MPKTLHHQSVLTILVGVILHLIVPSIFIFLISSVSIFCELQAFCHCIFSERGSSRFTCNSSSYILDISSPSDTGIANLFPSLRLICSCS